MSWASQPYLAAPVKFNLILVLAAVSAIDSTAGAVTVACDVTMTNARNGETKVVPLTMETTGTEGTAKSLQLFTVGDFNFSASTLAGQIVIIGEDPVNKGRLSSNGQGTANFRMESPEGILEAICNLK